MMETTETADSRKERALNKLKRDLGNEFLEKFMNPNLVEVMFNPKQTGNGVSVYWEEQGKEMVYDERLSDWFKTSRVEAVIKTVAGYHGKVITEDLPILESQFPIDGSRFTAILPPVTASPSFTIRKKPARVFTLDEYVSAGIMTESQRQTIRNAVSEHGNILVIGGTGSGKTTLINAILYDMSEQNPNERLYISEDTGEIQCHSQNKVQVYTTGSIDLTKLVKTALRYRPDRIIVGEVRGGGGSLGSFGYLEHGTPGRHRHTACKQCRLGTGTLGKPDYPQSCPSGSDTAAGGASDPLHRIHRQRRENRPQNT